MLRIVFEVFALLFILLCGLNTVFAERAFGYVYDLGVQVNEITNLRGPGQNPEFLVYSSVVDFKRDVDMLSDGQLAYFGKQAWEEMKNAHERFYNECKDTARFNELLNDRPGMVAVLAVGQEIYISSSIKGNGKNLFLRHENAVLTRSLQYCRLRTYVDAEAVPGRQIHLRKANCAEIMAFALFLQVNGYFPWERDFPSVRIVAFGTGSESVQKPCSGDPDTDTIGCKDYVSEVGTVDPVMPPTQPETCDWRPVEVTHPSFDDVWTIVTTQQRDTITGW